MLEKMSNGFKIWISLFFIEIKIKNNIKIIEKNLILKSVLKIKEKRKKKI